MSHIFISYAHSDGDFAEILINQLSNSGINSWVDNQHLRAGEDWRQAIDDAIRNAGALILIMSPSAKASEYVTYEWAFALRLGIRVIPLLLKPVDKLHPRLEALQYLDFSNRSMRSWGKLVEELQMSGSLRKSSKNISSESQQADPDTIMWLKKLKAKQWEVRVNAAKALGSKRDTAALLPLIATLDDRSYNVRAAAAYGLGQMQDLAAIPKLLELLNDNEPDVLIEVVDALIKLGVHDGISKLVARLKNANPTSLHGQNLQRSIIYALRKIGNQEALQAVTEWEQINKR